MFSRRLPWPIRVNRLSRMLEEKRRRGDPILDLTESNPTRVGLPYPGEEIAAALSAAGTARYEPHPRGTIEARRVVATQAARRAAASGIDPDRIVLTAGTSEAYALLIKLLADPGDAVLVPRPSYPLFEHLAGLEGVRAVPYALAADDDWRIHAEALETAAENAGGAARAVIVVNPNNPTGSALQEGERAALDAFAASRRLAVVSDEVFFDYLHDGSPVSMLGRPARALTFVLDGLSKSCGLPQMKLGWIVGHGPEALLHEALERLDLVADTYLSVGTPVQIALPRLLAAGAGVREALQRRLAANRAALVSSLARHPACRLLPSAGGWYAVVQVPAVISEEDLVLALLDEDGVLAHPGYFFDFPAEAYLVMSLLPEPDAFAEGIRLVLARTVR